MPVLECKHCGAPLSEGAASGPVTCPYCKTVNESTAAIQRPPSLTPDQQKEAFKEAIKEEFEERILKGRPATGIQVSSVPLPPQAKSLGQSMRSCLTGCGCLIVLLGGALFYGFIKNPGAVVRGYKQVIGSGLKPEDLRGLTSHDSVRLAVPPPLGGFSNFDPGSQWIWLLTQAKGWAPDARLRRLRVIRIHPNGSADLQGDGFAFLDAEFDSPLAVSKSLSSHARSYSELNTGLLIRIAKGQVLAKLEWGGARQPLRTELTEVAPLGRVLGTLKAAHRLQDQTLLNGTLTFDNKAGWVWSFQGITSNETMPKVRADGTLIR